MSWSHGKSQWDERLVARTTGRNPRSTRSTTSRSCPGGAATCSTRPRVQARRWRLRPGWAAVRSALRSTRPCGGVRTRRSAVSRRSGFSPARAAEQDLFAGGGLSRTGSSRLVQQPRPGPRCPPSADGYFRCDDASAWIHRVGAWTGVIGVLAGGWSGSSGGRWRVYAFPAGTCSGCFWAAVIAPGAGRLAGGVGRLGRVRRRRAALGSVQALR